MPGPSYWYPIEWHQLPGSEGGHCGYILLGAAWGCWRWRGWLGVTRGDGDLSECLWVMGWQGWCGVSRVWQMFMEGDVRLTCVNYGGSLGRVVGLLRSCWVRDRLWHTGKVCDKRRWSAVDGYSLWWTETSWDGQWQFAMDGDSLGRSGTVCHVREGLRQTGKCLGSGDGAWHGGEGQHATKVTWGLTLVIGWKSSAM